MSALTESRRRTRTRKRCRRRASAWRASWVRNPRGVLKRAADRAGRENRIGRVSLPRRSRRIAAPGPHVAGSRSRGQGAVGGARLGGLGRARAVHAARADIWVQCHSRSFVARRCACQAFGRQINPTSHDCHFPVAPLRSKHFVSAPCHRRQTQKRCRRRPS